ncbi:MAG: hypothetical protein U0350_18950 [Caldilineaceae bacterium]
MQKPNRTLAFIAYLLPIVGPLLVFLFNRRNLFSLYHACQSLTITLGLVIMPFGWLVLSWLLIWVPLIGSVLAASLFTLVMAAYLALIIGWVLGFINSLRAKQAAIPVFGGWGERLFMRMATPGLELRA